MSKTPVIVAAKRTPIGSFQGCLSTVSAPELGAQVIGATLQQAGIKHSEVGECIMGNVLTAGLGQAPARQAWLKSGGPVATDCTTINKMCGSGLKAVMMGADSIRLGTYDTVVVGGQENMSLSPYLLSKARTGLRLGSATLEDSIMRDGLTDSAEGYPMGEAAEWCAKEVKISRENQDAFAVESYKRAQTATKDKTFLKEIAPVTVTSRKGSVEITEDEEPGRVKFDKISTLRSAFIKDGTVTVANASSINDGASALCLMSEEVAQSKKIKILAKITHQATFSQEPKWFTTAPLGAIKKVLSQAKLTVEEIDLFEINEAFAVVTQAAMKELNIDHSKVNVHGGAVSLGHPIGASGARILTTLLYALEKNNLKRGLATLCIGGGEAVAVIIER